MIFNKLKVCPVCGEDITITILNGINANNTTHESKHCEECNYIVTQYYNETNIPEGDFQFQIFDQGNHIDRCDDAENIFNIEDEFTTMLNTATDSVSKSILNSITQDTFLDYTMSYLHLPYDIRLSIIIQYMFYLHLTTLKSNKSLSLLNLTEMIITYEDVYHWQELLSQSDYVSNNSEVLFDMICDNLIGKKLPNLGYETTPRNDLLQLKEDVQLYIYILFRLRSKDVEALTYLNYKTMFDTLIIPLHNKPYTQIELDNLTIVCGSDIIRI